MDLIKRYALWIILAGTIFLAIIKPVVIQTTLITTAAVMQVIFLAEVAQYVYSRVRFTNRTNDTDVTAASKIIALGLIYLGTAIVVGFVWYAVYYVEILPTVSK